MSSRMTTEEAIKILENGSWWDNLNPNASDADLNSLEEALNLAISTLRAQQEREKQLVWHKYSEVKPTADKDYCVIRQYHSQGIPEELVKDGEIWVEMDFWNNDSTSNWYGWESIGQNNPCWETLYWIDLGRAEVKIPDEFLGKVTRWFDEVVLPEG